MNRLHAYSLPAQCCGDVEGVEVGLYRKKAASSSVGEVTSSVLTSLKIRCRASTIYVILIVRSSLEPGLSVFMCIASFVLLASAVVFLPSPFCR